MGTYGCIHENWEFEYKLVNIIGDYFIVFCVHSYDQIAQMCPLKV